MKTFAVTGATGSVGLAVTVRLRAQGHEVRPIARAAGVSLEDPSRLRGAFADVDGAFVMVPFNREAADLHGWEERISRGLADALRDAEVPRVVFLSGTSADLRERAGSGRGAAMMEERLDAMDIPELVHLRGCFFMENHLVALPSIVRDGVYAWAFRADRPTPMVAAYDVGVEAARLLTGEALGEPRVRELLGPRDYNLAEAATILGTAIGKPDLPYVQLSYEAAENAMRGAGLSASFAAAVMETARTFNEGGSWEREPRRPGNTSPTSLETFARDVFAPAYHAVRDAA
jgi:uncharacterized protein YbjT (DUF2867 family)